jgi:hypothetical protein
MRLDFEISDHLSFEFEEEALIVELRSVPERIWDEAWLLLEQVPGAAVDVTPDLLRRWASPIGPAGSFEQESRSGIVANAAEGMILRATVIADETRKLPEQRREDIAKARAWVERNLT